MFSFLDPRGALGLRLPAEAREKFLAKYDAKLCLAHGKVLKEYVEVPDSLLRNLRSIKPYFLASLEHVRTLKPKSKAR